LKEALEGGAEGGGSDGGPEGLTDVLKLGGHAPPDPPGPVSSGGEGEGESMLDAGFFGGEGLGKGDAISDSLQPDIVVVVGSEGAESGEEGVGAGGRGGGRRTRRGRGGGREGRNDADEGGEVEGGNAPYHRGVVFAELAVHLDELGLGLGGKVTDGGREGGRKSGKVSGWSF